MNAHLIKAILIKQSSPLTLEELAQATRMQTEIIIDMVEHHLLEPQGVSSDEWRFDDVCFKRAKIAASFYQDLEINMPGIALALDLLEQINHLEKQLEILQQLK